MNQTLKVGISGVRGIVGESFTPQLAASFAQAFGTFTGRGPVLVGRDTRPSGPMFEQAVVAGLESVGCRPVLAGVLPTPTLLMLTPHLGARGAIAITASHNAAPWNALKFADRRGLFLSPARAEELFDLYHQRDFPLVPEPELPRADLCERGFDEHARRVAAFVDAPAIRRRRFRVVVDAVNGVGALFSAPLLRDVLGAEVRVLHGEPSGRFERGPEPVAENLRALGEAVVRDGADVGFAQDPDGDRLAMVSEMGEAIGEFYTLAFAIQQVLARGSRAPVVMTLSSSKTVEAAARAAGAGVIRTRIGEIHVSEAMLRAGAAVGGEDNGGVIVPAIHPCRDSFGAMAVILERLCSTGRTVSQLRDALPRYHLRREKFPAGASEAPERLRRLRRAYASLSPDLTDGVYVDFGTGWIHARRSNTEPVIRVSAEDVTPEAANARMADARAHLGFEL
jgi:phosphomannomutase